MLSLGALAAAITLHCCGHAAVSCTRLSSWHAPAAPCPESPPRGDPRAGAAEVWQPTAEAAPVCTLQADKGSQPPDKSRGGALQGWQLHPSRGGPIIPKSLLQCLGDCGYLLAHSGPCVSVHLDAEEYTPVQHAEKNNFIN